MENLFLTRTLGPISAKFIDDLLMAGKTLFTLKDAVTQYGKIEHDTIKFLSDLVKRGVIIRLTPGIFLIPLTGQENVQLNNWPIIARELAGSEDYFLSHYSAMRLHGMTTHPLFDVYITMLKRRAVKKISNITYRFIHTRHEFFWGQGQQWVTKYEQVCVSDLERTILDGLERPDLCGGIKEIAHGIWLKHKDIDWVKMLKYLEKFRTTAAIKRFGYVLELLGIGADYLPRLQKIIKSAKDYVMLDPNGLKEGKHLSRWRVRLNISVDELKASKWG